jgi:hypothetical protein
MKTIAIREYLRCDDRPNTIMVRKGHQPFPIGSKPVAHAVLHALCEVGHAPSQCHRAEALPLRSRVHDKSYLGDKYRRLRTKLGAPKAITAMAHQIARIIWYLPHEALS